MKSPRRAGARSGGREKRAKDQAACPAWRPHLSQYADQRVLTFASDGDLDKVRVFLDEAKEDYRDVLLWAEYPDEGGRLLLSW